MATCSFCKENFKSDQGVKAHMKWCDQYGIKKSKKLAALGRLPKAAATTAAVLPIQSSPSGEVLETTPPPANMESRPPSKRRRKYPVEPPSLWANSGGRAGARIEPVCGETVLSDML